MSHPATRVVALLLGFIALTASARGAQLPVEAASAGDPTAIATLRDAGPAGLDALGAYFGDTQLSPTAKAALDGTTGTVRTATSGAKRTASSARTSAKRTASNAKRSTSTSRRTAKTRAKTTTGRPSRAAKRSAS